MMLSDGARVPEERTNVAEIAERARNEMSVVPRVGATAPRSQSALAAVTLKPDGGGIAFASRLIYRVLAERTSRQPWLLELDPVRYDGVALGERIRFAARLVAGQLARRADWILFTHVNLARLQLHVPVALRRPYCVMVHDVEAWDPELAPDRILTMRTAALRLANSRYTAERVMRAHPSVGPVIPCPLALFPESPHGEPDHSVLASVGDHAVLLTGRMNYAERYKGHDQLLEAWPSVIARSPQAQLVFAGLGDDIPRLSTKALELGVGERVLFPGFVSESTLAALYRRCALFAMPSRREGFGLVYLEAMRAGIPCVASRADAAGDTVVDGETGILINGQSPSAIADAIVSLLTNDEKRRNYGLAGRKRFEALFTYDRFAERLLPILTAAFDRSAR